MNSDTNVQGDVDVIQVSPATHDTSITVEEFLRRRRALGGRATDRIGKGREYVAHDRQYGAAAERRRRQLAKRGIFGCAACGELTASARLTVVRPAGPDADPNVRHLVCADCISAATGDPS